MITISVYIMVFTYIGFVSLIWQSWQWLSPELQRSQLCFRSAIWTTGKPVLFWFSLTVPIFTYASSNVFCAEKLVKKINKEEEEEGLTPAIHSFKAKI
jgi:hypothetical protein